VDQQQDKKFEDLKKQAFGYVAKDDRTTPVIKYLTAQAEEETKEVEPAVTEPKGFYGMDEEYIEKTGKGNLWNSMGTTGEFRPDLAMMALVKTGKKATTQIGDSMGEMMEVQQGKGKRKWKKM